MIDPWLVDGPLPKSVPFAGWTPAIAPAEKTAEKTRNEPSESVETAKHVWIHKPDAHVYHHRATDEAVLLQIPTLEDTKELLSWSSTRQDEHKKRLIQGLMQGRSVKDLCTELGINKYTLAYWKDNDERIAAALQAWENSQILVYEERFDDIFFHPERYDKALSRPGYFQFTISRLKALDPRYKDNTQINVDNRSITIGNADASMLVGKARDQAQVIEGVKTALLARGRKPPTAS